MSNIYLHIGRHKSGTSTLQSMLWRNREILEEEGWLYPKVGVRNMAHHELANFFVNKKKNENNAEVVNDFLNEILEWENVIISSEAFQEVKDIEFIQSAFSGHNIFVLVYIREQVDYLRSWYAQAVHGRKITDSFKIFTENKNIDYKIFLDRWAKIFGENAISAMVYSRKELIDFDIVSDFLHRVGLDKFRHKLEVSDKDRNPSIGGNLLEFKRAINACTGWSESDLVRKMYVVLSRKALEKDVYRQKPVLSFEDEKKLRKFYFSSNESVREKYFPERSKLFLISHQEKVSHERMDWEEFNHIFDYLCNANAEIEYELNRIKSCLINFLFHK